MAMLVEVFTQLAKQFGVFRKTLHQNLAGAVQHRLGVGKTGVGIEKFFSFGLWRQRGIFQQGQRQRLNTGLAGDLRLGAALLLIGQVEVFQTLFGFGLQDFHLQFRR
ncbi:MAG: hypothetical protein BWY57_01319 [Betaproteobacteria bacterium ADurb.Bin341]|nr:MAG: hypothetical protein BWY57_01319 [Betaproteobacteria bacterium ADurb.Bin341]